MVVVNRLQEVREVRHHVRHRAIWAQIDLFVFEGLHEALCVGIDAFICQESLFCRLCRGLQRRLRGMVAE